MYVMLGGSLQMWVAVERFSISGDDLAAKKEISPPK